MESRNQIRVILIRYLTFFAFACVSIIMIHFGQYELRYLKGEIQEDLTEAPTIEEPTWICGTPYLPSSKKDRIRSTYYSEGESLFNDNCTACHQIHTRLVGPKLAGIFERRDSVWIRKAIVHMSKLIASGDSSAVALFEEYDKQQMPSNEFLSEEEVDQLMGYIKGETPLIASSKKEDDSDEQNM